MPVEVQSRRKDFGNRRFAEAYKYVARGWMPIQAPIIKDIKRKLTAGDYSADSAELINDLKSDFALFAYCLRELGTKVAPEGRAANPLTILKTIPHKDMSALLGGPNDDVGSHNFVGMREVQLLRLKHQLISCATAELIAEKQGIDPSIAFSAALLRQLGVALVAWNYPSTCAKAYGTIVGAPAEEPLDFDDELGKLVGFDSHLLGKEFLLSWSTCPFMELALNSKRSRDADFECPQEQRLLGAALREICEVGESLARVNDPTFYPKAVQGWEAVEKQVVHFLGENGVTAIRERVADKFAHYVGFSPRVLGAPLSPERQVDVINKQYAKKLLAANNHVRKCPVEVKEIFETVYDSMVQNHISVQALNGLVTQVVPRAGFLRGCIYLLDQKRMVLVPRLRLGGDDRVYRPISCSCGGVRTHPVAEAFHCSTPIVEENVFLNGDVVSHVTGKFGNLEKTGILYLEMTEALRDVHAHHRLLFFKAIRQCLNDCLNLH